MKPITISILAFLFLLSCSSKKEVNYSDTPEGRYKVAQALIDDAFQANSKSLADFALTKLDSIIILFPNSKEAHLADSVIKNKDVIYSGIENTINQIKILKDITLKENRKDYQGILRNTFLDKGLDIQVKISGNDNSVLNLEFPLFNDVWFRKFESEGFFRKWTELGFTEIVLTNNYNYTKTYK